MPISLNHQSLVGSSMASVSKSTYSPISSYSSYQRYTNSYPRSSSILDEPQLSVTGSSCLSSRTSDVISRLSKPRSIQHYDSGSYLSSSSTSALSRKSALDKINYKSDLSSSRYLSKYDTGSGRTTKKYSEPSSSSTLSHALLIKPSMSTPPRRSISTLSSQSSDYVGAASRERSYSAAKTPTQSGVNSRNGLRNIGNTCFLNAVVQCLSHISPLREYFRSGSYLADIKSQSDGALVKSFANLLNDLWDGENRTVQPGTFKRCLQQFAPCFMGNNQQDAQEFLRYLLEGLHIDVNRVRSKIRDYTDLDDCLSDQQKAMECWKRYLKCDNSKIVDLFVGQLKSTLKCAFCGHCSTTFDPFWDLSLSLPDRGHLPVPLSQCLDTFTRDEVLEANEMPTCSKCKTRRKCTKSLKIQRLPMILVLHLKRFSPSESSRHSRKLTTLVEFPLENLDLSPYTDSSSSSSGAPLYNLVAISKHSGTIMSGHYVAMCRQNDQWVEFNDERVTVKGSSIGCGDAYLLFYERNKE
ncbi:ubiquitin carboxyl-terminal hydrolase 2 [Nilaparvata lugens]|uniref:ubiquitin carboxyl-terminal hydrolase 2 n=1 Tax=Nilaparvata lugens TaxID=108931 RepID=UPI00193E93EF|nr:ubiquitin carboxyl-terminal hydrolase 2 [Nilaparvata lugens]XP_022187056.2 ubiquitin carboxyl-terminal hydrolase 2 [Nilaparvata lugens]